MSQMSELNNTAAEALRNTMPRLQNTLTPDWLHRSILSHPQREWLYISSTGTFKYCLLIRLYGNMLLFHIRLSLDLPFECRLLEIKSTTQMYTKHQRVLNDRLIVTDASSEADEMVETQKAFLLQPYSYHEFLFCFCCFVIVTSCSDTGAASI